MLDYAMLPPEVNSGRMYAGAGSGPMMAAAAAWNQLATVLSSTAASYRTVISELTDGSWQGPASASMAAAADPYVEWMSATAAQAEQTAVQAWAAVAAYETAFSATVPPPVIAANRAALATLVATNFFGQNTPAIAANQAEYAAMWAQDAAAMYGYGSGAAAATRLTPLSAAPQTTNPAGPGGQAAAAQSAAATSAQSVPSGVQGLLSFLQNPFGAIASNPLIDNPTIGALNGQSFILGAFSLDSAPPMLLAFGVETMFIPLYLVAGKVGLFELGANMGAGISAGLASSTSGDAAASTLAGAHGSGASAGMGRAAALGKLSVPQAWSGATQNVRLAAAALPASGAPALTSPVLSSPAMVPPMGGPVGSMVNTPQKANTSVRSPSSFTGMARALGAADAGESDQNRWAFGASADGDGLSQREQDELHELRGELADLAMDYDAMARLMREAMH